VLLRTILVAGIATLGLGCAVETYPDAVYGDYGYYDDGAVVATDVPWDIEYYPRVWYGGSYVYLVNGRWYAPRGRGWVRFGHEPGYLAHYRQHYTRMYGAGRPVVHGGFHGGFRGGFASPHAGGHHR